MKEVLPVTLNAPAAQHILKRENEAWGSAAVMVVFSSSKLVRFLSLSLLWSLSSSMEFQLPSITRGDLPVQKTNHQVSERAESCP